MIEALLSFVGNILAKLVGPLLAFFAGKEHEQKKEAERENETLKKQLEIAAGIPDSPDAVDEWLSDSR